MTKEQMLKLIDSKIETIQTLAIESIELIYNAAYNEGIEAALSVSGEDSLIFEAIRRLKK